WLPVAGDPARSPSPTDAAPTVSGPVHRGPVATTTGGLQGSRAYRSDSGRSAERIGRGQCGGRGVPRGGRLSDTPADARRGSAGVAAARPAVRRGPPTDTAAGRGSGRGSAARLGTGHRRRGQHRPRGGAPRRG